MPRTLYRVYVDESGDRGMTPASSQYFIMAALMVRDTNDPALRQLRDQLCSALGKPTTSVLHWAQKIKGHAERKYVADTLGATPYVRATFVIVDKASLRKRWTAVTNGVVMYNYAVRRLAERMSWCIDDHNGEAIVVPQQRNHARPLRKP